MQHKHAELLLTCEQFQLTVNITAVVLTFISAVASDKEESVLNAVQLLWVNLIMDTFAALALATDPPAPSILDRKPDRKSAPLITLRMYKMIFGQAICQLAITLVLHFAGGNLMGYHTEEERKSLSTLIFNTFVWLQIFNELNNRRLDNRLNVFEGITRNWFFIGINIIMVGGQVLIIFVGGPAFKITPLNGKEWGLSIALGAISLPFGAFIRKVPDEWVAACIPNIKIRMPWHKKKAAKTDAEDTEAATPVGTRDPNAKEPRQKVSSSDDDAASFHAPLRILTSLRGERARKHIRRGFREYMHDQKVKVKEKTKAVA